FASAARFIEAEFNFAEGVGSSKFHQQGAGAFSPFNQTLDERGRARDSGSEKTTGILLGERATHPKVKFVDLFQADFLLWLRQFFPEPGACTHWYPRCVAYARGIGNLEVFAKATSKNGLAAVRQLLKVNSLTELATGIQQMKRQPDVIQMFQHF